MSAALHTPGPWETSLHQKGRTIGRPQCWTINRHEFPDHPYEGQLEDEWGVYPPLGESGPVALVAGEDNARLIAASPKLLAVAETLDAFWSSTCPGGPDSGLAQMFCDETLALWRDARAAIAEAKGGQP